MNNQQTENNNAIDLRDQIERYLTHWKWFLSGAIISIILAFLYLRYVTPKYIATATIMIKDNKKSGISAELAAFEDLGIIGGRSSNNPDNEIEIIKSRKILGDVVTELNLNIQYIKEGRVKNSELYNTSPIKFNINNPLSIDNLESSKVFIIKFKSETEFKILDVENDILSDSLIFGESFTIGNIDNVSITRTNYFDKEFINNQLIVILRSKNQVIDQLIRRVSVKPVNINSSVLKISLKSNILRKSEDVLDAIITQYNLEAKEDKGEVFQKTITFINERLSSVGKELAVVEDKVKTFKKDNNITDIQSETQIALQSSSSNKEKLININIQLNIVKSLNDELKKPEGILPLNLGLQDFNIGRSIAEYNELLIKKNRLLKTAGKKNFVIVELQNNIDNLREALKSSLQNQERALQFNLNDFTKEADIVNSKILSIPVKEREFLDITRKQEIITGLYTYLLRKKEEIAISLAVTVSNAKIIDQAYGSNIPIFPKKKIVFLIALLLGLLIPFIITYSRNLLDTKVHTKKDIQELTSIPFIGDIPHNETNEKIIINPEARSSTSEAFRLIRTNLNFMLADIKSETGKTILITSTTSGEGKSFVSINLASTLALSTKKVILVGMDLRVPRISDYLEIIDREGVTNYIANKNITWDSLKFNVPELKNLDIITSGVIPPNPAELLMSNRIAELFTELKENYDYIIVDTAPVNLVTDTLLISKYMDLSLYTIRANYSDKRSLIVPDTLYKEKKLSNMAIILNDIDVKKGYGYGYGHPAAERKPWYRRIFRS